LRKISTKETYSITPAEKPVARERKRVFVLLAAKAMTLPTPVAMPAKTVSPRAIQKPFILPTISHGLGRFKVPALTPDPPGL